MANWAEEGFKVYDMSALMIRILTLDAMHKTQTKEITLKV